MVTLLDQFALFHDHNTISVDYGWQSMCDYDDSHFVLMARGKGLYRFLDHLLTVCVQGGCGLVEYYYSGFADECTSDWDTLLLATAQVCAFFLQVSLEPLWKHGTVVDKLKTPCFFRSTYQLFLSITVQSIGNVLLNCPRKYGCLLIDHTYLFSQFSAVQVIRVYSTEKYLTVGCFVKFFYQLYDGWLATSALTREGYVFSLLDLKVQIVEDLYTWAWVWKTDVLESDAPLNFRYHSLVFLDLWLVSHHFKNFLHCCCTVDDVWISRWNSTCVVS